MDTFNTNKNSNIIEALLVWFNPRSNRRTRQILPSPWSLESPAIEPFPHGLRPSALHLCWGRKYNRRFTSRVRFSKKRYKPLGHAEIPCKGLNIHLKVLFTGATNEDKSCSLDPKKQGGKPKASLTEVRLLHPVPRYKSQVLGQAKTSRKKNCLLPHLHCWYYCFPPSSFFWFKHRNDQTETPPDVNLLCNIIEIAKRHNQ